MLTYKKHSTLGRKPIKQNDLTLDALREKTALKPPKFQSKTVKNSTDELPVIEEKRKKDPGFLRDMSVHIMTPYAQQKKKIFNLHGIKTFFSNIS